MTLVSAPPYLGDFTEDETLHFIWHSFDGSGGSITRSTDGTISVYKDNGTTQSTAGVTDTEDFDSLTGVHACTIDLSSNSFYATGSNYTVVLSAATIDTQTVNSVLAHFSIENRFAEVNVTRINNSTSAANGLQYIHQSMVVGGADSSTSTTITDSQLSQTPDDSLIDSYVVMRDLKQARRITAFNAATDTITVDPAFTVTIGASAAYVVVPFMRAAANMREISGDATAADNLELMYDGTGYTDGSAPATQDQVTTVDANVDSIKTKTDSLTFTVSNQANVNIKSVNDITVTGAGTDGDPWGP